MLRSNFSGSILELPRRIRQDGAKAPVPGHPQESRPSSERDRIGVI